MGGSPGTTGSGKLAREQEGGECEFGEAFLTTVSAAICPSRGIDANHYFDVLIPFSLQVFGKPAPLRL